MTAKPTLSEDQPDPQRLIDAAVLVLARLLARQAVEDGSAVTNPVTKEIADGAQRDPENQDEPDKQAG